MPPKGEAPGLKWGNPLKDGTTRRPYWAARQVVRDPMGFPDKVIPLPRGAGRETLMALCLEHTARLLAYVDTFNKANASDAETEEERRNALWWKAITVPSGA